MSIGMVSLCHTCSRAPFSILTDVRRYSLINLGLWCEKGPSRFVRTTMRPLRSGTAGQIPSIYARDLKCCTMAALKEFAYGSPLRISWDKWGCMLDRGRRRADICRRVAVGRGEVSPFLSGNRRRREARERSRRSIRTDAGRFRSFDVEGQREFGCTAANCGLPKYKRTSSVRSAVERQTDTSRRAFCRE